LAKRTLNPRKELDAVLGGLLKAPKDEVDTAVTKPIRQKKNVKTSKR
jgi:hypothetical protein